MNYHKTIWENILVWTGVVTSFITPFLPFLQCIAVILAIAVSVKSLTRKDNKNVQ
jgi:hypothetical protein